MFSGLRPATDTLLSRYMLHVTGGQNVLAYAQRTVLPYLPSQPLLEALIVLEALIALWQG